VVPPLLFHIEITQDVDNGDCSV